MADFEGQPHVYESIIDPDEGEWTDIFLLQPINEATFQLVLEDWAIWQRWLAAYHAGQTTLDTHPALPPDRPRDDELKELLGPLLRIEPARAIRARAEFAESTLRGEEKRVRWIRINEDKL